MTSAICEQVLECNRRFYESLESLDVDAMDRVWETSSRAASVHPGGPWVRGWDEVRQSLEGIVDATSYIEFEIRDAQVCIDDPTAWVTCTERVRGGDGRVAELSATNIFTLGPDGWRLVLHHASPIVRTGGSEEE